MSFRSEVKKEITEFLAVRDESQFNREASVSERERAAERVLALYASAERRYLARYSDEGGFQPSRRVVAATIGLNTASSLLIALALGFAVMAAGFALSEYFNQPAIGENIR